MRWLGGRLRGRWRGRLAGQTGSVSLELAVLAPTLLLFIGVLVYGGRLSLATQAVQAAAGQAAREASIARTQPAADATAASVAAASLARQGLDCVTTSVAVDTTGFAAPAGTPATVTATVTCVVALADLSVPGLPGSQTVSAAADSPLDTYRER